MTLSTLRPQVAVSKRLFELKLNDRVLYDDQVYTVAHITKEPWSWAGQPVVYGMKFTIYLQPAEFEFTAVKPATSDKTEWDVYWRQIQSDRDRLQVMSKKIEACSMTELCIL